MFTYIISYKQINWKNTHYYTNQVNAKNIKDALDIIKKYKRI